MIPLILFILGLCMGSFAYAMTLRMYDGRDWVGGRSECEHCKHLLAWYDLIPLISWLSTVGRCRYCRKPVGASYPIVELGTGLALVSSYIFWPYGFDHLGTFMFVMWLVSLPLLVSLVIFDLKWYLLPDKLVFVLVGLSGIYQLYAMSYLASLERLPGLVGGIAVGAGVFYAIYKLSDGRYIGGGDVKFGLYFGILLGSGFKSLLVISIASLLGTALTIPFLISRRTSAESHIPFGPFLIVATAVVFLFGERLVSLLTGVYLFP